MRAAAVAGAISEIGAIALFAFIIVRTVRRSGHPASWLDGYVFASIAFFFIQAVYETGLLLATTAAPTRDALLQIVATWQGPLRDIQIHGFAMLMILGVGLKMFAPLFDFPAPSPRLVRNGLFLLLVAIVAEVAFFLLMRTTGSRAWTGGLYAANLLLAGTAMALTWGWLPRRGEASGDRSRKFVHVSAAWLYVSMAMLLLAPLYMFVLLPAAPWRSVSGEQAVAMGFSHAYYGAVRHAITVGFISLMILGMAAKVIPTLNGVDIRTLRPLWLPFALVNLGCLLRVSLQIATDLAPRAYPLVGVSGVLEVTGIAIWGVHLWRIMNGWNPAVGAAAAPRPARISPEDAPGRVVEWFPATLPVFLRYGLTPLANPLLRRTLGRGVTLRTAAAMRGIALTELVRDLNEAIESPQGRPVG
jgi:hypothetical protein